jgi:FkbM family methyltransferase
MRRLRLDQAEGHTFLALGQSPVVLDLSCSRGRFSSHVATTYGARVVALESDPRLTPEISNGVELRRADLGDGAPQELTAQPGSDASFFFGGDAIATVETVTLTALLREFGSVDLVKLDVEGAEINALLTNDPADLRRAGQLAVEFHEFPDPTLAPRVQAACAHLRGAGFDELRFSGDPSDGLFVSRERHRLSRMQRAALLLHRRDLRGARRILHWRLGRVSGIAVRGVPKRALFRTNSCRRLFFVPAPGPIGTGCIRKEPA